MENRPSECSLSPEDLRAALKEMKTYVDVTEEDLTKIFEVALRHARERAALRIPVREVMTEKVISISRHASLREAAQMLSECRISGMPVVDDQERVVGVISEADILTLAGLERGHTFRDILHRLLGEPTSEKRSGNTVGDVMNVPPITAKADDEVAEVAKILHERRIKRLPVVDENGRAIGIISRADIVRVIGRR